MAIAGTLSTSIPVYAQNIVYPQLSELSSQTIQSGQNLIQVKSEDNAGLQSLFGESEAESATETQQEPTYATTDEIVNAIKYFISEGSPAVNTDAPEVAKLHTHIRMFESVTSGYLALKYKAIGGRDLSIIPKHLNNEIKFLKLQHLENTKILDVLGTTVDQAIFENFSNRQTNIKLQKIIGAKPDGVIGTNSKKKAVDFVKALIQSDINLLDRIGILQWDSSAAGLLSSTEFGKSLLETGYPLIPNENQTLADVDFPPLMTATSRLENLMEIDWSSKVWNTENTNHNAAAATLNNRSEAVRSATNQSAVNQPRPSKHAKQKNISNSGSVSPSENSNVKAEDDRNNAVSVTAGGKAHSRASVVTPVSPAERSKILNELSGLFGQGIEPNITLNRNEQVYLTDAQKDAVVRGVYEYQLKNQTPYILRQVDFNDTYYLKDIDDDGLDEVFITGSVAIIGQFIGERFNVLIIPMNVSEKANQGFYSPLVEISDRYSKIWMPGASRYHYQEIIFSKSLNEYHTRLTAQELSSTAYVSPLKKRTSRYELSIDPKDYPDLLKNTVKRSLEKIDSDWMYDLTNAYIYESRFSTSAKQSFYGPIVGEFARQSNENFGKMTGYTGETTLTVAEKQKINFGLVAKAGSSSYNCTSRVTVNGKTIEEKSGSKNLNIRLMRTFPKGKFTIGTSVNCPVEVRSDVSLDPLAGYRRPTDYSKRLESVKPFVEDIDNRPLPTKNREALAYAVPNFEAPSETFGRVLISSDQNNSKIDEAKVYRYDFTKPFSIVDFSLSEASTLQEKTQTKFSFDFVPQMIGEHSLNLQVFSNISGPLTGSMRTNETIISRPTFYHPRMLIELKEGSKTLASASRDFIYNDKPTRNLSVRFQVTEEMIGAKLTFGFHGVHDHSRRVGLSATEEDMVIVDILNQSERSHNIFGFEFLGRDHHYGYDIIDSNQIPFSLSRSEFNKLEFLGGQGMHMIKKYGILPNFSAQITIKTPEDRHYRFFKSTDMPVDENLSELETYEFHTTLRDNPDSDDTSWLD